MRRALAAAVLAVSLWLGSLAWTGFVLLRTVLDPDRSRAVAESLYEDERVRDQLAAGIASGVRAAVPPGEPLPEVEAVADEALASPTVQAVFVDALARTHAAFLGEGRLPRQADAGALGVAAREAAVAAEPALSDVLPAAPELVVPLPTERVPNLGPARDRIAATVPVLAVACLAGSLLALLVTSDRPAVLRRAGRSAIGLSAAVLLLAYGVPLLAEAVLPGQAAVVAVLVRAVAEAARVPALALAATGAFAVVGAVAWRRRPPVVADQPAAATPAARRWLRRSDVPRPRARATNPAFAEPAARSPVARSPAARYPADRNAPARSPAAADPHPGAVGATRVDGAAAVAGASAGRVVGAAEPIPAGARWVAGVGYVVDGS